MVLFLFSLIAIGFAMLAMALGVLAGKPPLTGSCGGAGGMACAFCARPCMRKRVDPGSEDS